MQRRPSSVQQDVQTAHVIGQPLRAGFLLIHSPFSLVAAERRARRVSIAESVSSGVFAWNPTWLQSVWCALSRSHRYRCASASASASRFSVSASLDVYSSHLAERYDTARSASSILSAASLIAAQQRSPVLRPTLAYHPGSSAASS